MDKIIERLEKKKDRFLASGIPVIKRLAFNEVKKTLEQGAFPIIFGLRRTGKTTILKQLLAEDKKAIYITFRDMYISNLNDFEFEELIEKIYDKGYRTVLLDEAQIKPRWSEIVVSVFDSFPDIRMVVTGSSSLNLELKETGLDRTRKINVQTLSFGEYCLLTNKEKSKENFETFLGAGGFPEYAIKGNHDFDIQRSEIFDEILSSDIPSEFSNIEYHILVRLIVSLARRANGEINLSAIVKEVSPNFLQRDALRYIDVLEKARILKVIYKINSKLEFPKVRKFKIFINPHIHIWIVNTHFKNIDDKLKGHIVESYWLTWALSLNSYNKTFYYLKDDKTNKEIDFVSINNSTVGPKLKTLHEFKYSKRKNIDLSFMKSFKSLNKIIWNIEGNDVDGVEGKSILDTFDQSI